LLACCSVTLQYATCDLTVPEKPLHRPILSIIIATPVMPAWRVRFGHPQPFFWQFYQGFCELLP